MSYKKIAKNILVFAQVFVLFYLLNNISIVESIKIPLATSLLFAILVLNRCKLIYILSFMLGSILSQYSVSGIYMSLSVGFIVLAIYIFQKKKKIQLNKFWMILPLIVSLVPYVILNVSNLKMNLFLCFAVLVSVLFYFVCFNFLGAIYRKGNLMLNLDEKVCGGVMLVILSMGIYSLKLLDIDFLTIMSILSILTCTYCFSSGTTLLIATLLGVGSAIISLDITLVALYVIYAVVSLAFKSNIRVLSAVGVVLTNILFGLYFKILPNYGIVSLLYVVLPAVMYVVIPKKALLKFKDSFAFSRDKVAVRSLVNRTKSGICKRMNELANVFNEMDKVFRNMVKGTLTEADANLMITSELITKVCGNCPEKNKCLRNNNTKDIFSELIACGFERGKATLLDVPQYLTSKCGRVNFMLSTLNQELKSYKNYTSMVTNMDASRVLIADQLGGVSEILGRLAEEIKINISYDMEKENRIMEELNYASIICFEVVVYAENKDITHVTLLLKNEKIDNKKLEKVVSRAINTKLSIVSIDASSVPGTVVVNLKNSPNFDLVFGVASISKNGVLKNGDAHSLIKLENGKYIMSLCDGIGSGEKAREISNLSIELIENFYKAGFDNETILNSVNRLLSLNNEENFSSVDLCVMDFHKNLFDFIKLGATYGFVKNSKGTDIIESSGLPIGVLEEMRPHITEKYIGEFDTVVLISDGISDAFVNKSDLQEYINSISSTNPQTIADEIMDRARDLNNGVIKDDMTVLVARVFPI